MQCADGATNRDWRRGIVIDDYAFRADANAEIALSPTRLVAIDGDAGGVISRGTDDLLPVSPEFRVQPTAPKVGQSPGRHRAPSGLGRLVPWR